jgi:hypothetical protein
MEIRFDKKKKPKKSEIVKQNQFKKWFQTKLITIKKTRIKFERWNLKGDEIKKTNQFYKLFKIKKI